MSPQLPHQATPPNKRRIYLKVFPVITLDLTPASMTPQIPLSPTSIPRLSSALASIPEDAPEHALLTCPSCFFIEIYHLAPQQSSPACARCMRRFRKREGLRRDEGGLISFPRLLEEHAVVREREEKEGVLGRIWGAVWGGGKGEEGAAGIASSSVEWGVGGCAVGMMKL
jgi:hypothetical protein